MKRSSRKEARESAPEASAYRRGDTSLEPLSLPKDALVVAFLDELRAEFLAKGYKANGNLKPDAQREERIQRFVKSCRAPLSLRDRSNEFSDAVTKLLTKFERLCERTGKFPSDPIFTRKIYRYLADQLSANVEFFQFPKMAVLLTPTLMTSQPLVSLPETLEQRGFPTDRRLFYRAFTSHSQGVVKFFEDGAKRLAEIDQVLAKHPGWALAQDFKVQLAFFRLSQDIEKLVVAHRATVDQILITPPYKSWFQGQRSVVEVVVGRFKPDQVRKKLQELNAITADLLNDDDLKPFKGRRSAVLYAAMGHFSFSSAKEQLLKAHQLEERLVFLHKSNNLTYNLKELRDACLKNYDQANRMAERLSLR
jgi:hypothetical protein